MSKTKPAATPPWRYLFAPESVAVIGASNTPGSWGNNIMKGLLATGKRRLYPVHPKEAEITGLKAYPTITAVPEEVDLAVIVVAAPLVPAVLRECAARPVKAVSIISAGFGETGGEGQALENELVKIAAENSLRFIGPNSMGHADTRSQLSTFGQPGPMPEGAVALLSQSGSTCVKIARNLNESGIALSKYVSTGNEASLHLEDYLEYLAGDADTKIIAAYIEGLREGRRFFRLAKELTLRKPMVVVKIGGTEESARAVMSHTGALAGADAVYSAAFKQSGIIRVEDDDELADVVFAMLNCPLPKGNRIGILSIGGGPGALTAEACEKEGLAIGKIAPETITRLDECLPARWSGRNPVDMAGISAAQYPAIASSLWALLDDDNIDIVLLQAPIIVDRGQLINRMSLKPEQIKAYREKEAKNLMLIRERVEKSGKPVILMWQSKSIATDPDISSIFAKAQIPVYSNARRAARVLRNLFWYRRYLEAAGC